MHYWTSCWFFPCLVSSLKIGILLVGLAADCHHLWRLVLRPCISSGCILCWWVCKRLILVAAVAVFMVLSSQVPLYWICLNAGLHKWNYLGRLKMIISYHPKMSSRCVFWVSLGSWQFLAFMCPGHRAKGLHPPTGPDPKICPRRIFGTYDDHDYSWWVLLMYFTLDNHKVPCHVFTANRAIVSSQLTVNLF